MEVAFEYIFWAGLVALAVGVIWFLLRLIRGPRKKAWVPLVLVVVGLGLMSAPAMIQRALPTDLGPRETFVDGEMHLGLTGWDGEGYAFLTQKSEAVVLQMANPDVTNETLQLISGMEKLRKLDLGGAQITDSGLAALAEMQSLEELWVGGTKITDAGFKQHLMPLKNLKRLDVRNTAVSAETIANWKAAGEGRRAHR